MSAAILLSWLGMAPIAGVAWLLLLGAAIGSVIFYDAALGFFGFIYIACGALGLLLNQNLSLGGLMQGIKGEYSASGNKIKDDIVAATNKKS